MKKFALTGYPLGHSMSPVIHKELFKLNNIDADYFVKEIAPENLKNEIENLKSLSGFNVTIPHKTEIIKHLDKLSDRAELFGAVNTVSIENGFATGHNTDCTGFLNALDMSGISLGGKATVCGCGGVSRMFAFECVLAGADLTLAVRDSDIDAGTAIKNEIKTKLKKEIKLVTLEEADGCCDILINGTPVGMYPHTNACILPYEKVKQAGAVFDAVYNPLKTQLIQYAEKAGIKHSNGLSMLVWQAAVAQEIWFGSKFTDDHIRHVLKITETELSK